MGLLSKLKRAIAINAPSNPLKAAPANNSQVANFGCSGIGFSGGCGIGAGAWVVEGGCIGCGCDIGGGAWVVEGGTVGITLGAGGERAYKTSAAD